MPAITLPAVLWRDFDTILSSGTTWRAWMEALRDHLSGLTGGHVEVVTDGTANVSGGQPAPYLELAFVVDLGGVPFHVLLLGADGTALPDAAQMFTETSIHNDTRAQGDLFIGYARAGRTAASLADPLGAASPYGSDDWTGYWKLSQGTSPTPQTVLFCDSAEIFALGVAMSNDHVRGCNVGAVAAAATDTASRRSDGRITGIYSWGLANNTMLSSFRGNPQGGVLSFQASSSNQSRNNVSYVDDKSGELVRVACASWGVASNGPATRNGFFRDIEGNLITSPLRLAVAGNASTGTSAFPDPGRSIGALRGVADAENHGLGQPYYSGDSSAILGYALSPAVNGVDSALMLINEG